MTQVWLLALSSIFIALATVSLLLITMRLSRMADALLAMRIDIITSRRDPLMRVNRTLRESV